LAHSDKCGALGAPYAAATPTECQIVT